MTIYSHHQHPNYWRLNHPPPDNGFVISTPTTHSKPQCLYLYHCHWYQIPIIHHRVSGGKSVPVSYLNKRDSLLPLTLPMSTSSTFAVPLGHLLPKPCPKPPMSPLTPPYLAMVIGNRNLDFNVCVCVCERERERGKKAYIIGNRFGFLHVCVCEKEREREA